MAELFSGPLMSIALVILAGIALRYALWMGKDQNTTVVTDNQDLQRRNDELATELERVRHSEGRLKADNARIKEDYESLRRALDERPVVSTSDGSTTELEALVDELSETARQLTAQRDSAGATISEGEVRIATLTEQLEEVRGEVQRQKDERQSLLAMRDEVANESMDLAGERESLVGKVAELSGRIALRDEEITDLQAQLSSRNEEFAELKTRFDEEHEGRLQDASLRRDLERQCEKALETANERCEQLEAQCQTLTSQYTADLAQANAAITDHEASMAVHTQLKTDLETTAAQYESTLAELNAANAQLQDGEKIKSQIEQLEMQLEDANQDLACMRTEVRFVSQIRFEREQLQSEVNRLTEQLEAANQHETSALEALRTERSTEVSELKQLLAATREDMQKVCDAEAELRLALDTKDAALVSSQETCEALKTELEAANEKASGVDRFVAERDEVMANMKTEKDELTIGLRREQEAVQQLTAELEEQHRDSRRMRMELSHLELLRQDHNCLGEEMQEVRTELGRMQAERDELDALSQNLESQLEVASRERDAVKSEVDRYQREYEIQEAAASGLIEDNDKLQIEIAKLRTENRTLEEVLSVHSDTLQKLRVDSHSIETLLERQAAVQESLDEHASRLRAVARDREVRPSVVKEYTAAPVAVPSETKQEIYAFDSDQRDARIDSLLGLVFDRRPSEFDDLQQISGIGPVLTHKLNRLGIYRFEQIMNLSPRAVQELSRLLAFKDRIEREDWIGQAERLCGRSAPRVA